MTDYERVASIIRYLDQHRLEQPTLGMLAKAAGMSPFGLHRLFARWAGVTPKDFLQSLTFAEARRLLREGRPVLESALASGLSGPGRLHDLCISMEAASPGELKSGGTGWTIRAGLAPSPFGDALIAEGPRGICHLAFAGPDNEPWEALRAHWPQARIERDDRAAAGLSASIFAGNSPTGRARQQPLRAYVRGTAFQVRVWRALLNVPEAALTSYGRLAGVIGMPGAARAVGGAVGSNPLAWLIPCHRVIRETGAPGNYRWDPVRKRAMLACEASSHPTERQTV
jgi:AraC family transcriptional regulator of adaptative response/methylated-DNA-[protein]-cysteine methyltransferase